MLLVFRCGLGDWLSRFDWVREMDEEEEEVLEVVGLT